MTTFQPTRRQALKLAAASLATPSLMLSSATAGAASRPSVDAAVQRFGAHAPKTSGCLVVAGLPDGPGAVSSYSPTQNLFVGSAVKTFILGQFLIDVESGRNNLSGTKLAEVSDAVRTPGSPVLIELAGKVQYRSALEAMIAHSDNIGTDLALAAVGPQRVRDLVAHAGLPSVRIPDSTRILFSYLAGAPAGTDIGWAGMQKLAEGGNLGFTPRSDVINDKQSMTSSAADLVKWYQHALRGDYFKQPASLTEFKRISAMADAAWMTVPDGLPAYGKGGSLDWEGKTASGANQHFHALCFAGQMLVGKTPVTFSFTWNWLEGKTSVERTPEFIAAVSEVLKAAAIAEQA